MAGYGTDLGATDYWAAAGYTVPSGVNIPAARQRGSVYVDGTFGARFPGVPTAGANQDRAWPRTGAADIYGNAFAPDDIPQRVEAAAYEAAYIEAVKPGSLAVTFDPAKRVKRQKVDTIEREFFEPSKSGDIFAPNAPVSSVIEGILLPLIGPAVPLPAIAVV